MNANQIVSMVMRMVMRKAVNKGIDAGVNMATRRRGAADDDPAVTRQREAQGRNMAKNAKQMMRMGRRLTRM